MAGDQKPSNVANNSIILASLVAAGSHFFHHQAPLQGLRPETAEPQIHQAVSVSTQDIDTG